MINGLIRCSALHSLSMIKDKNSVTECLNQCQIMTDQNGRIDCQCSGDCSSLALTTAYLMGIAVCVFFFQAASFQKFFHFSPGFGAAYPHISQAFSDSVPERTARIKGFHWHLKYHLNIPLLPEKASFRNYTFPDSLSFL